VERGPTQYLFEQAAVFPSNQHPLYQQYVAALRTSQSPNYGAPYRLMETPVKLYGFTAGGKRSKTRRNRKNKY